MFIFRWLDNLLFLVVQLMLRITHVTPWSGGLISAGIFYGIIAMYLFANLGGVLGWFVGGFVLLISISLIRLSTNTKAGSIKTEKVKKDSIARMKSWNTSGAVLMRMFVFGTALWASGIHIVITLLGIISLVGSYCHILDCFKKAQ